MMNSLPLHLRLSCNFFNNQTAYVTTVCEEGLSVMNFSDGNNPSRTLLRVMLPLQTSSGIEQDKAALSVAHNDPASVSAALIAA